MAIAAPDNVPIKEEPKQPEAKAPEKKPEPAPTPEKSAREIELEGQLKERDTKIADLSTGIATIEERQRQLDAAKNQASSDTELEKELEEIENLRLSDPVAAVKRNAELLKKISSSASTRARGEISQQAQLDKLRTGVKSSNPDFDDDVVDYVMERADALARTGKFKTADEAIAAATTLVKSKFEGYAAKRNAVPALPPGARAEGGGNPPPVPEKKDAPLPTPSEELNARKDAQQKKIL